MKKLKLVALLFDAIGVIFVVIAVLVYSRTQDFLERSTATEGIVIDLVVSRSSGSSGSSRTYYPVVKFTTAKGEEIEFKSNTGSSPPSHREGEIVSVRYDPADPYRARIDSFFSLWGLVVIPGALGLVFSLVGGILFVVTLRSARLEAWLQLHGRDIEAEFQSVELNRNIRVNGRHPYRIACQWQDPRTNKVHVFMSSNIWFDPESYIPDGALHVKIDPNDPHRYSVDTSFLPEKG